MLSKRACVFYLEHCKVVQNGERVLYLNNNEKTGVGHFFNIPEKNTSFILLGKGTSITDAAVRRLASSNVLIGFCGSGGSPLFSASDASFLTPQSEYRPTEYMQYWAKNWFDENWRLSTAKKLLLLRMELVKKTWRSNQELLDLKDQMTDDFFNEWLKKIENQKSVQQLLSTEGQWAKILYARLASAYKISFTREQEIIATTSISDRVNAFLNHGNYIAYGYAAVALHALGISFALPILHGKTRRGGLVFDLADIVKDSFVMPLAFHLASNQSNEKEFRDSLIETCQNKEIVETLFTFITSLK